MFKKILSLFGPVVFSLILLEVFFQIAQTPRLGSRFTESVVWREKLVRHKSKHEIRIFGYGESSLLGAHYAPYSSPLKWMAEYLNEFLPDKEIRVVNFARMGRGSDFALQTLRETLDYKPDLVVVYLGHNDFLPDERYSDAYSIRHPHKRFWGNFFAQSRFISFFYRTAIRVSIKRRENRDKDRMGALTIESPPHELNMGAGIPPSHPDYALGLNFYRENLETMIQLTKKAGIPIMFVRPVANLKDFAPLQSMHLKSLNSEELQKWEKLFDQGKKLLVEGNAAAAFNYFDQAYAIDPTYADLPFYLAKIYFDRGDLEKARSLFIEARDRDVMMCRANSDMLRVLDQLTQKAGVPLLDAEKAILPEALGGIPGEPVIDDNVHLSIPGHARLGRAMTEMIADTGWLGPRKAWNFSLEKKFQDISKSFGLTSEREAEALIQVAQYFGTRYENRIRVSERALQVAPKDALILRNLAWTYWIAGRKVESIQIYKQLKSLHPDQFEEVMKVFPDILKEFQANLELVSLPEKAI